MTSLSFPNSEHWEDDTLYKEKSKKGDIHETQQLLVLLFEEVLFLSTAKNSTKDVVMNKQMV